MIERIRSWPRPLRWVVAVGIALVAAVLVGLYGEGLGDDTTGAMLRGLVIGAITVASIRFMRLGKWDTPPGDR